MKMRNIFILVLCSLMLNGCVALFESDMKELEVIVDRDNIDIYVDDAVVSTAKDSPNDSTHASFMLDRDCNCHQLVVKSDSIKSLNRAYHVNVRSPWYIMSIFPGVIIAAFAFDDLGNPYIYSYDPHLTTTPLYFNKYPEKQLEFESLDMNMKPGKYQRLVYNSSKSLRWGPWDSYENDSAIVDKGLKPIAIINMLEKCKFADSNSTIFNDRLNTFNVSAEITAMDFIETFMVIADSRRYVNRFSMKLAVNWYLTDYFNDTLLTYYSSHISDPMCKIDKNDDVFEKTINDALEYNTLSFLKSDELDSVLSAEQTEKVDTCSTLHMQKSDIISSTEEAIQGSVIIKSEGGHGSGFAISQDGYIITNFHVVAGENEITIICSDGQEYTATLIRSSRKEDLALLKTDRNFLKHFELTDTENAALGEDVYTVGAPKNIKLGQSISTGIIAGLRSKDDMKIIQTDISTNSGNSGGPVFYENGQLVGVVVSKIFGFSAEGLSFAIPAYLIKERLKLDY